MRKNYLGKMVCILLMGLLLCGCNNDSNNASSSDNNTSNSVLTDVTGSSIEQMSDSTSDSTDWSLLEGAQNGCMKKEEFIERYNNYVLWLRDAFPKSNLSRLTASTLEDALKEDGVRLNGNCIWNLWENKDGDIFAGMIQGELSDLSGNSNITSGTEMLLMIYVPMQEFQNIEDSRQDVSDLLHEISDNIGSEIDHGDIRYQMHIEDNQFLMTFNHIEE